MWLVTVKSVDKDEHTLKIYSNSIDDLFDGKHFRWEILNGLMEKGILEQVRIDFKPSLNGVRRIKRITVCENGTKRYRYIPTIDNVIVGKAYVDRQDAWAVLER